MAGRTKSKEKEKDNTAEFFEALALLEQEKGIPAKGGRNFLLRFSAYCLLPPCHMGNRAGIQSAWS